MSKDNITIEIKQSQSLICNEAKFNYIHIKINNLEKIAEDMMVRVLDNSWLKELDNELDYNSFLSRSKETIELLTKVLKDIGSEIGAEFGEYLISSTALTTLEETYNHETFPLAEIWKEKAKGNPGFDFHSLSTDEILFFGEAKFNSNQNSYSTAISQICKFITKEKDIKELTDLAKLNHKVNNNHLTSSYKGYVAAFSVHNNFENIFSTIQNNKKVLQYLCKYPEIIFIGIEL